MDCSATAANASLISNRSTSAGVFPSRPRALRIAFAGWDSSDGSGPGDDAVRPDLGQDRRAQLLGLRPRHHDHGAPRRRRSAHADPAVTVPSAENAGRSLASDCGGGALADALVVGDRQRVTAALRDGHVHDLVVEQPVLPRGDRPLVGLRGVGVLVLAGQGLLLAVELGGVPHPAQVERAVQGVVRRSRRRSCCRRSGSPPGHRAAGTGRWSSTPYRPRRPRRTRRC